MTDSWDVVKDDSALNKCRIHPGQDGDGVKAGDRVAVQGKDGNLWTGVVKSEWTDKATGERYIRVAQYPDAPQWTPHVDDHPAR